MVKERALKAFLDSQTDLPVFVYNQATKVCSGFRPDFKCEFIGWTLFIECDEHQHKRYTKEEEMHRMKVIVDDQGWLCVFIRFNPDLYKMNKIVQKIQIENRYQELKKSILRHIDKNWAQQGRPLKVSY